MDFLLADCNDVDILPGYAFTSLLEPNIPGSQKWDITDPVKKYKEMCDPDPDCAGFNSLGKVHSALPSFNTWASLWNDPCHGYYVKDPGNLLSYDMSLVPTILGYQTVDGV